jgi:integrase
VKISKRQIILHGSERWQVEFGRVNGVRLRPVFETEAEADAAIEIRAKEERRFGEVWLQMPPNERYEVMAVYSEARRAGLSLRDVWDRYRENSNAPVVSDSIAYEDAVAEWKRRKLKAGKDCRYVKETAQLLLRFAKGQLHRAISEFLADELEIWMDKQEWDLPTRKSNIGRFSSLWKVALDRRWVTENIVERLEPVGKISVDPEIFEYDTCLRLMAVSLLPCCNRIIAPVSLGLFGGMRPDEASHEAFGWHRVNLKTGYVTVTGEVAKTADRRTFKPQPNALQWLRLAHKLGNPLPPVNERRQINLACEIAGITHWPNDVLRKTCATHLRNHYENDWHVIRDLGNSIRMLLKHYVDLHVPARESKKFWRITPALARSELQRLIATREIKVPHA